MFQHDLGIQLYFYIQKFTFHRLGIDLTTKTGRVNRPYFLGLVVFALATIHIPMVVYSKNNLQDIAQVTNAMAPAMQGSITLFKIWQTISKRKEMSQLVQDIYLMSTKASKQELRILLSENNREHFMNTAYYYSVLNTGILAMIAPVLVGFIQYIRLGNFSYIMVLRGSYPIQHDQPLNYFLIWIWSAFAIYGVIYGSVSVDTIYSWYIHNIVGNFKILQSKLASAEFITDLSERRDMIYSCVHYHQRLIATADQLELIYRPIIFVEFSLNTLQICFLAYQIGSGVVAAVDLSFLFLFITSVGIQLMIYCYGGQHLQNESGQISISIYKTINSPAWPIPLRKVLLLAMMRAQKSCKLTGIFFDVDLRSFLWVWRTAGSYVTLLRSVEQGM
ncbi:odorant receptor 45a-like [Eurosta solidaginis]|uniref:odorant receptor 45a-like n=1 Tax=Eurosta solidaginis TaxID=178769 RepID=UPI003530E9A2